MSPSLVEFNQNNFFFQRDCWEQKQKTKGVIWVFVALSWQHDPLTLMIERMYGIVANSKQICYMSGC